jgi:hypothetical protein
MVNSSFQYCKTGNFRGSFIFVIFGNERRKEQLGQQVFDLIVFTDLPEIQI